jgi:hypothetical protein
MRAAQNIAATATAAAAPQPTHTIIKQKKSRWWEVRDPAGEFVCLTVYRRGAREAVRRLDGGERMAA